MKEGVDEDLRPKVPRDLSLGRVVWTVRSGIRSRFDPHPALYLPIARRRYPPDSGAAAVGPGIDIVIDGFQRSGTTFATLAFMFAQSGDVRVAHHLHAPAQFVEAAKQGIPALLLVRHPDEAVISRVIQVPQMSLHQTLRLYVRFHERLVTLRGHYVAGLFPQVTTDLGQVVDRVNTRFNTSFDRFDHTPDNEALVFRLIEERHSRGIRHRDRSYEASVARPSSGRQAISAHLADLLASPALSRVRARAIELYEVIAAG
jgi:hypothetical protein